MKSKLPQVILFVIGLMVCGIMGSTVIQCSAQQPSEIAAMRIEINKMKVDIQNLKQEIETLKIIIKNTTPPPTSIVQPKTPTPTPTDTSTPTIKIIEIPRAGKYPDKGNIGGIVTGISNVKDYRVVIYSETDQLYVQPYENAPLTQISADEKWGAKIFLGDRYYVLLVHSSYQPETEIPSVPNVGGDVIAVTTEAGKNP